MTDTQQIYIVQRLYWERSDPNIATLELVDDKPVRAFRDSAQACRMMREREIRDEGPGVLETVRRVLSFPEDLLETRIEPLPLFEVIEVESMTEVGQGNLEISIVRWAHEYFYFYDVNHAACRQHRHRLVRAFDDPAEADDFCESMGRGRHLAPAFANPFIGFRSLRNKAPHMGVFAGRSRLLRNNDPPIAVVSKTSGRPLVKFNGLGDLTSFPEPVFHDWVLDCGLTPPEPIEVSRRFSFQKQTLRDWDAWWEANAATMTDEQRRHIWQALDKLRFFEIVRAELEE